MNAIIISDCTDCSYCTPVKRCAEMQSLWATKKHKIGRIIPVIEGKYPIPDWCPKIVR